MGRIHKLDDQLYKLKLCFTSSRAPAAFYQNDLL